MRDESSSEGKRRAILELAQDCDQRLRLEFGPEAFEAGWCLLLGRYYAQSTAVYLSLNPGFPRSRGCSEPCSIGCWNVPFLNPPELCREYVYLHNCQRFFASDAGLNHWINQGITSAFLVPWRTTDLQALQRLNAITAGRLYEYARRTVDVLFSHHQIELMMVAGKSTLDLLATLYGTDLQLTRGPVLGLGRSYQWSRSEARLRNRNIHILQIPHFSRANSPAKMEVFRLWFEQELRSLGARS